MECKNCKYFNKRNDGIVFGVCNISHRCNTKSCTIASNKDIDNMNICYNCQHWIGGGDWGLSCAKDYYKSSSNGFDKACEQFERKEMNF